MKCFFIGCMGFTLYFSRVFSYYFLPGCIKDELGGCNPTRSKMIAAEVVAPTGIVEQAQQLTA